MLFADINNPTTQEIKDWMIKSDLSISSASELLGISKRQFLRMISGVSKAKRRHSLAMQMIWLINENKKNILNKSLEVNSQKKIIKIPIR